MFHYVQVILTILLVLQNIESKKKTRSLYFISTKCSFNKKYLNNFEVIINPGNLSLNMIVDIERNITDVWSSATMLLWLKEKSKYRKILSYDIDVCQFLQTLRTDRTNMLNTWFLNVFKYGNLSRTCPVIKNLFYLSNFKPEKDSIPPYAPVGKFRLTVAMYTKQDGFKESVGTNELSIELK